MVIVMVYDVGLRFSVVTIPRRRDGRLPANWPPSEPSFFRQTGWARFLWPAGRASIGRPLPGSIHRCRTSKPFPSASDRPRRVRSGFVWPRYFPLLLRLRFRGSFVWLHLARAGLLGDSRGQPSIVRPHRVDDHHAFVRDDIFADVLSVIAAAHLDDDHHLPKLAIDLRSEERRV